MPKATQRAQIQPLPPSLVAVKPRKVVQILSVTVGIMAIVIVVLVVLLLRKEGNGGRQSGGSSQSAAGISKTCTLPELAEYLIKHKIAAEVGSYMHASPPHPFSSDKGKMPLVFIDGEYDSASILIIECDDELSAKHGASANARLWSLRQYYWINWGRFAFQVQNEATAKQITELLR
ncbi:MAG: hypothetical protein K8T89_22075 [Planctomycetes bacterium]|nr:hypothetical protein [Planctomycetota bacterium]